MKRCHVIDNFLPDPNAERARALEAPFHDVEHRGLDYAGISPCPDPLVEARVRQTLGVIGGEFTTFFRRYVPGENPATFIHNDSQIGVFSGILFLSAPEHCRGGLAFWRHRLYGWETQPEKGVVETFGEVDSPAFWNRIKDEGFDEPRWEMVDYVPMEFNRLVLFPSGRYHSRYPKEVPGKDLTDCRLIKTFFWLPGDTEAELAERYGRCAGCGALGGDCYCRDEKRDA